MILWTRVQSSQGTLTVDPQVTQADFWPLSKVRPPSLRAQQEAENS